MPTQRGHFYLTQSCSGGAAGFPTSPSLVNSQHELWGASVCIANPFVSQLSCCSPNPPGTSVDNVQVTLGPSWARDLPPRRGTVFSTLLKPSAAHGDIATCPQSSDGFRSPRTAGWRQLPRDHCLPSMLLGAQALCPARPWMAEKLLSSALVFRVSHTQGQSAPVPQSAKHTVTKAPVNPSDEGPNLPQSPNLPPSAERFLANQPLSKIKSLRVVQLAPPGPPSQDF